MAYAQCCGAIHAGDATAETPADLMRSRYSAFVKGNVDYLIASRHPRYIEANTAQDLAEAIAITNWVGLQVLHSEVLTPKTGQVEFSAFSQRAGKIHQQHELSDFARYKGRWVYTEGQALPPIDWKRNQPCWCNSGKKYKHCHG